MVENYTMMVGLNDGETHVQQISTVEAYKVVLNCIKPYVKGATISEAFGYYIHDDGTTVTEKSLRVEILFFDDANSRSKVEKMMDSIKIALNQESIALTYSRPESILY